MKPSKLIIIAALAVMLLPSCKDFLNPDSISTFDTNYVFSNVDDARKGVNAIYYYFGVDGFRSRLSNNMTGNTDIERSSGWTSSGDRYQIWDLNALSTNGDLRQFWNAAYGAIRDANIAIEGLEASEALNSSDVLTNKTMHHMMGEVYTLRAYWYSMLVYYFGDVPNVRQAPKAGNDFFLPREDRNVILSQVITDMMNIEGSMLWADELPYGIEQANREYTLGMIARIALQRGGYYLTPDLNMERQADYQQYYQIAKEYTEKLMTLKDRELPADYRQVFLNNAKFITPVNDDILFEVPFAIGNGDVGWNIGVTVQGGATASHNYGSGNNYMAIPVSYYYSFDTLDIGYFYQYIGNHYTTTRLAQYTAAYDGTQVYFYNVNKTMGNTYVANSSMWDTVTSDLYCEWNTKMLTLKSTAEKTANYRSFIAYGKVHTISMDTDFYTLSQDGTSLVSWYKKMIEDDSSWNNVLCTSCIPTGTTCQ